MKNGNNIKKVETKRSTYYPLTERIIRNWLEGYLKEGIWKVVLEPGS